MRENAFCISCLLFNFATKSNELVIAFVYCFYYYGIMNNSVLKSENISQILEHIILGGATSRKELVERTGLSKMSVTNFVNDLIARGIVEEGENIENEGKGRPSVRLKIAEKAPAIIGVALEENKVTVTMSSLSLNAVKKEEFQFNNQDPKAWKSAVFDGIDSILRKTIGTKVFGISICDYFTANIKCESIGSNADSKTNQCLDLQDELMTRYSLPVFHKDNSVCSALFETYYGVGKSLNNCVFIDQKEEIKSVLLLGGKILSFENYHQPQIGHISIDYNGLPCKCGNHGCLTTYVATGVMVKKLKEITKLNLDFKGFCEYQVKKNDARIDWIFKDMMDKFAAAFITYANLMHPEAIIMGGDAQFIPDRYLVKLQKQVNDKCIDGKRVPIQILKPSLNTSETDLLVCMPLINAVLNRHIKLY